LLIILSTKSHPPCILLELNGDIWEMVDQSEGDTAGIVGTEGYYGSTLRFLHLQTHGRQLTEGTIIIIIIYIWYKSVI